MPDLRRRGLLAALLVAWACSSEGPPPAIPDGTFGGEDAGVVVEGGQAHVHVGCTAGNFPGPIPVGGDGAFRAEGRYSHMRELFPINNGQSHPAELVGRLDGIRMRFEVRVSDGGEVYGPAEVRYGATPSMQDCPICRFPPAEPLTRP